MCQVNQKRSDRSKGMGWKLYIHDQLEGTIRSWYRRQNRMPDRGYSYVFHPLDPSYNQILEIMRANASKHDSQIGYHLFETKKNVIRFINSTVVCGHYFGAHVYLRSGIKRYTPILARVRWHDAIATGKTQVCWQSEKKDLYVPSIRVMRLRIKSQEPAEKYIKKNNRAVL